MPHQKRTHNGRRRAKSYLRSANSLTNEANQTFLRLFTREYISEKCWLLLMQSRGVFHHMSGAQYNWFLGSWNF